MRSSRKKSPPVSHLIAANINQPSSWCGHDSVRASSSAAAKFSFSCLFGRRCYVVVSRFVARKIQKILLSFVLFYVCLTWILDTPPQSSMEPETQHMHNYITTQSDSSYYSIQD